MTKTATLPSANRKPTSKSNKQITKKAKKPKARNRNKEIPTKHLLSYPDVFADVMNLVDDFAPLRISEDKLTHIATRLPVGNKDSDLNEINRFVTMEQVLHASADGEKFYLRLGIENQSAIDPFISRRALGYSEMEEAQMLLENKKGVVITTILYFGIDHPWPQAKSVGESLQELSPAVREISEIKGQLEFRVRIIDLGALSDDQIAKLQSDIHNIAIIIKALRNKQELPELTHTFKHVEESIQTITALLGSRDLAENILSNIQEGENINMEVIRPIISKRDQDFFFARGEARGEAKTLNMVNKVKAYLKLNGRENELLESPDLAAFIKKIYEQEINKN